MQSTRGAQGGYSLAKNPEEISVGEILRALEGSLSPVDCSAVDGEGETECSASSFCVTKYVWKRINDSINETVNNIFLSELLTESENVKSDASKIEPGC